MILNIMIVVIIMILNIMIVDIIMIACWLSCGFCGLSIALCIDLNNERNIFCCASLKTCVGLFREPSVSGDDFHA